MVVNELFNNRLIRRTISRGEGEGGQANAVVVLVMKKRSASKHLCQCSELESRADINWGNGIIKTETQYRNKRALCLLDARVLDLNTLGAP